MSIEPEILDLIQAEIDGVATEAEQVRLRDAVSADAAVREEYRRLRGLCDLLAGIPPTDPPARLASSVMSLVRSRRHDVRGKVGRIRALWPGGRLALRYGYALAAGVVIGALGLHVASGGSLLGPPIHEGDARATIAPAQGRDRLDLTPAGIQGFATLMPSASGTAIKLDLHATEPVEFMLRYEPTQGGDRVKVVVVRDGVATEAGSLRVPRVD